MPKKACKRGQIIPKTFAVSEPGRPHGVQPALCYSIMFAQLGASFRVIRTSLVLWWGDWLILAALNLGWVLCWLTVVLGPPATFALSYAAHLVVRGQTVELLEVARSLRRYLLKSWLWMLANLLVAMGVWLNLQVYLKSGGAAWLVVPLLLGALWASLQLYALPYLSEQGRFSLRQAFRNALFTFLASPLYSVVLVCFVGLALYLGTRLVFLFFLGLPCLVAVLGACAVKERLENFRVRERDEV